MNRLARYAVLTLLFAAASARAQGPEPLKHLGPYLGDDSFVVGWVDVRNVDLASFFARFEKLGVEKSEVDTTRKSVQTIKDRLLEAGVTYVYATNLGSVPQPDGLLVAPAANPQAVKNALAGEKALHARVVGNAVLIGTKKALDMAADRQGKASPEWAQALGKLSGQPSRIVILPPRVLLRAFAEIQPALPAELGGGSTAEIFDSLQWASIGFDLSAKAKFEAIVQLKDEAAAKRLDPILDRLIALAKKSPEAQNTPVFGKLIENHRPKQVGDQFRLSLDDQAIDSAFLPLAANARQAAKISISVNTLRQIGLGMHMYHDVYKWLPPQASASKDNKSLLSWRVQILPFLEQKKLYDEFHHDEPWDSEHNKKLVAKMPRLYHSPLSKLKIEDGKTTYVVPAGPKLVFDGIQKTKLRQIPDGTSNTILALDVDDSKAVIWTKPEDYPVAEKKPNAGLFRPGLKSILAAFCDGSVRLLSAGTTDDVLWLYFCPSDGQAIPQE